MDPINERVSMVISTLGITKTAFANSIHVTQAFISMVCAGRTSIGDRTISDICREYGVDEVWLRTGAGEMFAQKPDSDELAEAAGILLGSDPDATWTKIVMALINLPESDRRALEHFALELVDKLKGEKEKESAD